MFALFRVLMCLVYTNYVLLTLAHCQCNDIINFNSDNRGGEQFEYLVKYFIRKPVKEVNLF